MEIGKRLKIQREFNLDREDHRGGCGDDLRILVLLRTEVTSGRNKVRIQGYFAAKKR